MLLLIDPRPRFLQTAFRGRPPPSKFEPTARNRSPFGVPRYLIGNFELRFSFALDFDNDVKSCAIKMNKIFCTPLSRGDFFL